MKLMSIFRKIFFSIKLNITKLEANLEGPTVFTGDKQ